MSHLNDLILTRAGPRPRERLGKQADPVPLEVFNNRFMGIAEQMGEALRLTAQSVNIKERLDFSCAVFDTDGDSSPTRRTCRCTWGAWTAGGDDHPPARTRKRPGDAYTLNAPYDGGTHLPDITVVTPVFDDAGAQASSTSRAAGITRTSAA